MKVGYSIYEGRLFYITCTNECRLFCTLVSMKQGYFIHSSMKVGYSISCVIMTVLPGRLFYTLMGMKVSYSNPNVPNR